MQELWLDEVFCWNNRRAELATVVAAFYFEASVFNLLDYGLRWLDPKYSIVGVDTSEYRLREEAIWRFLDGIKSYQETNEALQRVFHDDGKSMLGKVLGEDAQGFWERYQRCREWRNIIAHRGARVCYEDGPNSIEVQMQANRDQMLWASLVFIPTCWAVFSRLWNEYIHKPMLKRKQNTRE